MNDTLKIIANRYSCRAYTGAPVEKEVLDAIALAAVQSPSAVDRQPWKIHVITDKKFLEEMDAEGMRILSEQDKMGYERFMDRGGNLYYNAPCMVLILKKPGTDLDCGIVSENVTLAAMSLGLGSVICGMAAMPFAGPKGDGFKARAGIDGDWEFGMSVLVGHAAKGKEPHAPDMSKVRFID